MKKKTTALIVTELRSIFPDYDYNLVEYNTFKSPIKVGCPKHGVFETTPRNMIERKKGCPLCGGYTVTTETFIVKARSIHGDRYDYSKVDYQGSSIKVEIGCKIHNTFFQMTPHNHTINKQGCVLCRNDSFRKREGEQ
jgi:hypothetical protein